MPALIAWLLGALETTIGSIIVSALLSLGLGFTTYKFTVEPLKNFILSQSSGLGATAVNILGFLGLDQAITMILSAIAARYAVSGARAVLTRKKAA
ncbi:DUF2523 domain-containing protein [Dyella ginsengisoli]|uniref:DUF2523 domain-containing protein n=1 Tax=Dyella ginsengisoli TaxID=363848 RepID=A0ABW8JXI9_9GAMM